MYVLVAVQGLLEKQPSLRLDWPQLLDHPFLAETAADKERLARDAALAEQKAETAGVGATPTLLSRVQSRTSGGGGAAAAAGAQGGLLIWRLCHCGWMDGWMHLW